jgi:prophage regulatory protein
LAVKRFRGFIEAPIRPTTTARHGNILPPSVINCEVTTMAQTIQREPAILRRKHVETRTGLSRSTIYRYIKDGVFPKPVPLGPRAVGWLESEVSEWIAERVKIARDGSRRLA